MPNKQFKVVSVSSNRNSFGLVGMVLVAQDGEAWEVAANDLNKRKQGEVLTVPLTVAGELTFAGLGFEIPRRLQPDCPPAAVKEIWA